MNYHPEKNRTSTQAHMWEDTDCGNLTRTGRVKMIRGLVNCAAKVIQRIYSSLNIYLPVWLSLWRKVRTNRILWFLLSPFLQIQLLMLFAIWFARKQSFYTKLMEYLQNMSWVKSDHSVSQSWECHTRFHLTPWTLCTLLFCSQQFITAQASQIWPESREALLL